MCTPNETTKNEEMLHTLDLSTMNEEELTKLHNAATAVIEASEVHLMDLTNDADHIVAGTVTHIHDELMAPAAQRLMKAAGRLLNGDKGTQDRLAKLAHHLLNTGVHFVVADSERRLQAWIAP